MEDQKLSISKGICVSDEFPDAVLYVAHDICSCEECSQELWFEFDEELRMITMEVGANFENYDLYGFDWKSKSKSKFLYRLLRRLKVSFKILLTGKMSFRHYFMFKDDNIENYIKALQEAYNKLKQFKITQEEGK